MLQIPVLFLPIPVKVLQQGNIELFTNILMEHALGYPSLRVRLYFLCLPFRAKPDVQGAHRGILEFPSPKAELSDP